MLGSNLLRNIRVSRRSTDAKAAEDPRDFHHDPSAARIVRTRFAACRLLKVLHRAVLPTVQLPRSQPKVPNSHPTALYFS